GALIVVFVGVGLNELFKSYIPELKVYPSHLVYLPQINNTKDLMNGLHFPDFSALLNFKTYWIGFTLALVASLETLLNIDASDKLKKVVKPSPANRELIAQGIGNLTCGLIGGIPITSVIVRSSANINAGAKSKLSGLTHGVLLLLSVLLFPGILNLIPYAALSAILLITGYKLTQVSLFKHLYSLGWQQFLPFIVTVVVMLLTGILKGIFCGLLVAVYFIIRDMMRIPIKKASSVIDGKTYTLITFPENVTFINKGVVYSMLQKVPSDSILILDGTHIKSIDYDVLETITLFKQSSFAKHIEVQILNIQLIDIQSSSH
ncbi:MAG: SulP family inorganic anion transporter, partial [Cytophagales bacterium]|nr:SulP family inorganic anion transporter [Cytophaga sp.]